MRIERKRTRTQKEPVRARNDIFTVALGLGKQISVALRKSNEKLLLSKLFN
jgi:hypothetical protein